MPIPGTSPQPKKEPEPEPEPVEVRELDELEQVYADRYLALLNCGIDPATALLLIHIPDIGHAARDLRDAGCSPELIAEILA